MTERLFLAIPIINALRDRLRELQEISLETLRDHGITSVRPENLRNSHITVRFLGDTDAKTTQALIELLNASTLDLEPFDFCVNAIGVFDSPRKARVLWAGVDQHEPFKSLKREVDALLAKCGIETERKPYAPHLTLMRFREITDISSCFDELKQLTDVCAIERYPVNEVVLYSSKLSPQGATHTKRALLKLTSNG